MLTECHCRQSKDYPCAGLWAEIGGGGGATERNAEIRGARNEAFGWSCGEIVNRQELGSSVSELCANMHDEDYKCK